MTCLSWESLLSLIRGQTDEAGRAGIAAHLANCRRCQGNQQWLAEVLRLTAEDPPLRFPAEIRASVINQFRQQAAAIPAPPSKLKLVAQLIFDSLLPQPLAAVRSESGDDEPPGRQMLYHADGYDIDLRFERGARKEDYELIGQALALEQTGADVGALEVELLRDELVVTRAQTDERGLFRFVQIPAGVCDLRIILPTGEISIRRIPPARGSE
jgi:hypothetical protein